MVDTTATFVLRAMLLTLFCSVFLPGTTRAEDLLPPTAGDYTVPNPVSGGLGTGINLVDMQSVLTGNSDEHPLRFTAAGIGPHTKTTVIANNAQTINYTPRNRYDGPDSFSYTVSNDLGSATGTIFVTIKKSPANFGPVSVADSYTIHPNETLTVSSSEGVLKNDSDGDEDPLTVRVLTDPDHGSVTLNSDGSFVYIPEQDYSGTDSFSYVANDGITNGNNTSVTITIPLPSAGVSAQDLQAAIDSALPRQHITVSGSVTGDITVPKEIHLTSDGTARIVGSITITGSNASLDGFTITNPDGSTGIVVDGANNVSLTHNTVSSIGTNASSDARGIFVTGSSVSNLTISENTIDGVRAVSAARAISIETNTPSLVITDNIIRNVVGPDDASGIYVTHNASAGTISIHENNIDLATIAVSVVNDANSAAVTASRNFWGTGIDPTDRALSLSGGAGVLLSPWYAGVEMISLGYPTIHDPDAHTRTATLSDGSSQTVTDTRASVPVTLEIPAGTDITADESWDGSIVAPTATNTVSIVDQDGYRTELTSVVAVGASTISLTLSHAAKLLFANQAGRAAGWIDHLGNFSTIPVCTDDEVADPDTLPERGDCTTTSGSDLIVWTKHFTTFATFSYVPTLTNVHLASSNANPLYAQVGDTLTLSFSSSASIDPSSVAVLFNHHSPATDTGGGFEWTYVVQSGDPEGVVTYDISFSDVNSVGGAATQADADTQVSIDTTAPVITTPGNFTVNTTSATGDSVGFDVSTNDGSSVTCTPASNTLFALGDTTVTCSSTDAVGNAATTSFVVSVVQSSVPSRSSSRSRSIATPITSGSINGGQVLGASAFNFTQNLTLGSKGGEVTELQNVLIAEGYLEKTRATGYFGNMTLAAVKKYQVAHGITPVSGYVGPKTRAVLNLGTTSTNNGQTSSLQAQIDAIVAQIKALQAQVGSQ